VYIRILLFYISGVTVIGLLVPSNDPGLALESGTATASPFVIAIKRSGIKALPGVRFVFPQIPLPVLQLDVAEADDRCRS